MISIYQDHYTKPVRFSNDKFYLIIPNYIFIFLDKIKEFSTDDPFVKTIIETGEEIIEY